MTRSALFGLVLMLAIFQAPAQNRVDSPQSSPPATVIRINVNLVQVDAVVTDSKDQPVTDLTAADFEVRQDGKLQKITNCTYITTAPAGSGGRAGNTRPVARKKSTDPAAPPVPVRNAPVRRTFAFLVDDLGISFSGINYVRKALTQFVDQDMQPGDLVAIVRTSAGMGLLQQFTTDKRILRSAIGHILFSPFGRVGISGFERGGAGQEERSSMIMSGSLAVLNYVVGGVRELPGRKAVVLFTEHLPMTNDNGRDARAISQVQRITDLANRSSVVISTIDPAGLQYFGPTAADGPMGGRAAADISSIRSSQKFNAQGGMQLLAEATGGLFQHDNNDITAELHRAVIDGDGYYLIGYRPDETTFQRKNGGGAAFHNIQVHVKRAGLHVRSRKGFLGNPDPPRRVVSQTPQGQLVHAATSPLAASDIHIRMTGLFTQSDETGATVNAMLFIDTHDIQFEDAPDNMHKAVLDIVIMVFNENGQVEDPKEQIHTLTVPDAEYRKIMQDGLVYMLRHQVKRPGGYQMRIAVRDNGTLKLGSASQYVEVPDLSKHHLALASIFMQKATAGGSSNAASDAEGQIGADNPMRVAALREFHPGDALLYACKVINARLDSTGHPQMEAEARIFRDGKQVNQSQARPIVVNGVVDPGKLTDAGQLMLGKEVEPGDYVLQLILTDKLADAKYRVASQWMDFVVK